MTPPLRRLDAALVPRLAAVLRGIGYAGRGLARATGRPGAAVGRLARRNPTFTTAVVAVVVAAGLIAATGGDRHHAVAPAPPDPQQVLPADQLGPTPGDTVANYRAAAQQRLSELTTATAGRLTAVVDFNSYLTAPAVASVLSGLPDVVVSQAYARVAPPASGGVHAIALGPSSDLALELTRVSRFEHRIVVNYRKRVALANQHPTAANLQVVSNYATVAAQAKTEARAIGANVGCVFALTASGPASQLKTLAARSDVRILDPAPPNVAAADLMVVPLEPQVTDVVPVLSFDRLAAGVQ